MTGTVTSRSRARPASRPQGPARRLERLRLTGVTAAESSALRPFPQAHASCLNYAVNDYGGPGAYRKVIGG